MFNYYHAATLNTNNSSKVFELREKKTLDEYLDCVMTAVPEKFYLFGMLMMPCQKQTQCQHLYVFIQIWAGSIPQHARVQCLHHLYRLGHHSKLFTTISVCRIVSNPAVVNDPDNARNVTSPGDLSLLILFAQVCHLPAVVPVPCMKRKCLC